MYIILEIFVLLGRLIYYYSESLFRCFFPPAPKNVRGQVVLITGGAKGIGRALAFKFAGLGAKVAIWDMDKTGNDDTVRSITSLGGTAVAYYCDVTSVEAVRSAAQKVRRDVGKVDILVNNAGIMPVKKIMDLSETEIRRTMDINCVSHFWTVREFLPAMIEQKRGHIVSVASMAGLQGVSLLTDYCASKHGAIGFADSLREELRVDKVKGINITVVCPMQCNTNLIGTHGDRIVTRNRFGGLMTPEEAADGIINGVLRNKTAIFLPPFMRHAPNMKLFFPQRFAGYLFDFMDTGFWYAKK